MSMIITYRLENGKLEMQGAFFTGFVNRSENIANRLEAHPCISLKTLMDSYKPGYKARGWRSVLTTG